MCVCIKEFSYWNPFIMQPALVQVNDSSVKGPDEGYV